MYRYASYVLIKASAAGEGWWRIFSLSSMAIPLDWNDLWLLEEFVLASAKVFCSVWSNFANVYDIMSKCDVDGCEFKSKERDALVIKCDKLLSRARDTATRNAVTAVLFAHGFSNTLNRVWLSRHRAALLGLAFVLSIQTNKMRGNQATRPVWAGMNLSVAKPGFLLCCHSQNTKSGEQASFVIDSACFYLTRAILRHSVFSVVPSISEEHLMEIWRRQGGRCFYSGRSMTTRPGDWSASLERLDEDDGYMRSNYKKKVWRATWPDKILWLDAYLIYLHFVSRNEFVCRKTRAAFYAVIPKTLSLVSKLLL